MNPFQIFIPPQQQQPQQSQKSVAITQKSPNGKKLKLTSAEDINTDWDLRLLIKAINNSSTQRLSGDKTMLDPNDLISIISQFALQFSRFQKMEDISIRKWCIVEVDQLPLRNKEIGIIGNNINSFFNCGTHCDQLTTNDQRHQYNIMHHIQVPSTTRPYCLILNMADRQLHFQSHEQPNNKFFINLDTIETQIQQQQYYNVQYVLKDKQLTTNIINKPIVIKVKNKKQPLLISLYLTAFTLPFPFKQNASQQQKSRHLLSYRQSLYNLLNVSINQSRGNRLKLNKILDLAIKNSKKFYNSRYATEEQFATYCQSGDLILFQDNHTMAKVQRAVTGSPYDHVGVVYKTQQLGICVFESSSALGVGLASWKKLIRSRWFENIDRIVWRKLQIHNKPADFDQKIDEFVKGNLHKQFGLSLPKLLKFKSVTYSKDSHKSYFCSELVGELYRYLGLLDPQKSSSQYWPKDFADGNGIKILNGALDMERQIIFEDPLLKQCYPFYK